MDANSPRAHISRRVHQFRDSPDIHTDWRIRNRNRIVRKNTIKLVEWPTKNQIQVLYDDTIKTEITIIHNTNNMLNDWTGDSYTYFQSIYSKKSLSLRRTLFFNGTSVFINTQALFFCG